MKLENNVTSSKIPANTTMFYHSTVDWCHICGKRSTMYRTADIWYPMNAEHPEYEKTKSKYIRICGACAYTIYRVTMNDIESEEDSDE